MTGPCFVDANVLVYVFDPRDAAKQARASAWRELLWRSQLGRTSTQVLSETYVALKRLMGGARSAEIWTEVARYFAWNPLPVDEPVLRRAHELESRYKISWWDSLIVAAAQLQDCELLLTEDLQDGMKFGTLTVRSPFTLAVEQPAAPYAVPQSLARLHRRRGRPRKEMGSDPISFSPAAASPPPRASSRARGLRG
jgi:predicted nucleic acid-binding protein